MSAVEVARPHPTCVTLVGSEEDDSCQASCLGVLCPAQPDVRLPEANHKRPQSIVTAATAQQGQVGAKRQDKRTCTVGQAGLCGDEGVSRSVLGKATQDHSSVTHSKQAGTSCIPGRMLGSCSASNPEAYMQQWQQRTLALLDPASTMEQAGWAVRQALSDESPEKPAGTAPTLHDSTSSLANVVLKQAAKECPYFNPYSGKASAATEDRREFNKENGLLRKEWEIDPLDIIFCAKKGGHLIRLGKGAFGTVYKGVLGKQTVAVKVGRQDKVNERVLQQFRNEVAILHANQNEGLVQFKGACLWEEGKRMVLVTEYMSNGDVFSAIGRNPERYCWHGLGPRIALDVAKALRYLHERDVVHFDLKSGNILLDRQNRAKLADVGLAKLLTHCHDAKHLCTMMATSDIGTFAWAAPEVLLGFPCNQQADVFSFGVLLWELVTTEVPRGRCLRPIRVPEECSESVANLVMACMRHEPGKRPTSAQLVTILTSLR